MAGCELSFVESAPVGLACVSGLVAHPAAVGTAVREHSRPGLQFADYLPGHRPVVVGQIVDGAALVCPAVPAVTAVRTVEPHFEDVAVVRQQFCKLVAVVIDVSRSAVVGVVAVPGGEVDAELQAILAAGVAHFADKVAAVRGVHDVVLRVLRVPEAEAVMVLRGQDYALEARAADYVRPLARVAGCRVEDLLALVAVAPLQVGESVRSEMDEDIALHIVPAQLPLARNRTARRRLRHPHARCRQQRQKQDIKTFHDITVPDRASESCRRGG